MRNKVIASLAVVALVSGLLPSQAAAGPSQKGYGWLFIGAGSGLVAASFNYNSSCPAGYSTHTFQGLPTQCVYISPYNYNSDVTTETTTATFKRPAMLWTGVGAIGTGTILLMLPKKVQKHAQGVGATVSPTGWQVSKTVSFGGTK